jgi:hypothetical protein
MARVFAVQVQSWLSITSVAVQNLMRAIYLSPVTKLYTLQWSGPGLSPVTELSWEQEQIAKTVTSNLPLLSVLAVSYFLFLGRNLSG